jgi:hypothetical protein
MFYKDKINKNYKTSLGKNTTNTIGFIPITFDLTLDGISGIKIYQQLNINQDFLPYQYPESFKFLITKVNHRISDNGWDTQLNTISTSNIEEGDTSEILTTGNATPAVMIDGDDPAIIINPNKIGALTSDNTPIFNATQLNFRNSTKEDVINRANRGEIVKIGIGSPGGEFAPGNNALKTVQQLNNIYYLQPKAAEQFIKWINELRQNQIPFQITSAIRFGENTGGGAHGYGIAVDFGNLYQLVGGSTDPIVNKNARIQNPIYKQIAEIGAKYNWYNPWRLSDDAGIDEIWHFEYWGPA